MQLHWIVRISSNMLESQTCNSSWLFLASSNSVTAPVSISLIIEQEIDIYLKSKYVVLKAY